MSTQHCTDGGTSPPEYPRARKKYPMRQFFRPGSVIELTMTVTDGAIGQGWRHRRRHEGGCKRYPTLPGGITPYGASHYVPVRMTAGNFAAQAVSVTRRLAKISHKGNKSCGPLSSWSKVSVLGPL